jgi:hypothetical protein
MESSIQRRTIKYAKTLGLRASKFVDASRRGAPDLIIWFTDARVLFIETKYGKGKTSEHQKEYHRLLREEGHTVVVANTIATIKLAIHYFRKGQAV